MPTPKNRASAKFLSTLIIFGLIGQIAWVVENMYFNVFIYKMFHASPADISAMVMASAVAATVTTLLMGALSDKLGRRKVFIAGGYILWGISILSFALIREDTVGLLLPAGSTAATVSAVCVTLVIVLDCVMTFFGSTANDACFNAWLTDSTTHENRGAAEGINAMMPLVAILAVFGGFMGFDLNRRESWTLIFIIIGAAVMAIGVLGFFLIREPHKKADGTNHYFANILYGFRPSVVKENPRLYLMLAAFAVFGISIQIFMPYLILYYTEGLRMEGYVLIMAPAIILASVFTVLWGRVHDKVGFTRSVFPALGLLCGGYILLYFFRATPLVFVGSLLMMCGYLAGSAVFGAMIRDYTPEGRAGMFQGLRIVGQVLIPGLIGPAIGARVLRGADTVIGDDGTESFIPNQNIFLAALVAAVVLGVFLAVMMAKNKRQETSDE